MLYSRGDVIAVSFNYSDFTGRKLRPALIVSSDTYNLIGRDVVAGRSSYRATEWPTVDSSSHTAFQFVPYCVQKGPISRLKSGLFLLVTSGAPLASLLLFMQPLVVVQSARY